MPYDDDHSTTTRGLIGNTCGWLFHQAEYKMWTSSQTSQIVWLHDILSSTSPRSHHNLKLAAGAGKTKLTSRVADTFRNSRKEYTDPAYFYCSQAKDERRRAVNDLRSFVKQLGTKEIKIHQNLLQAYDKMELTGFASASLTLNILRILLAHNTSFEVSQTLHLVHISMCYGGHLDLIQLMLDTGADVNQPCEVW